MFPAKQSPEEVSEGLVECGKESKVSGVLESRPEYELNLLSQSVSQRETRMEGEGETFL